MTALWERFRQRKLVQWTLAYLAGAWALLQVLGFLTDSFDWPKIVPQGATVLLGAGLLAVLVLAWYHGERGEQRVRGPELVLLAGICLVGGLGMVWVGMRPAKAGNAVPASGAADTRSIAVLPFENLSGVQDNKYFSDGVTDEILNALAQVPGLRVAGGYSSAMLKEKDAPLSEIARQLKVGSVLQGSVRREGDRVRITAQLVDTGTGDQLWAQSYDASISTMLSVQEQIAREIVAALRIRLGADEMAMRGSTNPRAHDLYLRGMYEWRTRRPGLQDPQAVRRAIDYLRQSIALDPSSAVAQAGLSRAYETAPLYLPEISLEEGLERADSAAHRALALDSTLATAHSVLAWTLAYLHRDYAAAEREHRRALALNPNDPWNHWSYAEFLRFVGRPEAGVQEAEKAINLDPFAYAPYNTLGQSYAMLQRYADAEAAFTTRRAPVGLPPAYGALVQFVYVPQGRIEEARATLEKIGGAQRNPGLAAYIEAAAGRKAEAQRFIRLEATDPNPNSQGAIILAYVALGQRDSAFASIDRLADTPGLNFLASPLDSRLAPLRDDPRYPLILRKLRLR